MQKETEYIAGLYCRLSKEDEQCGESVSISTQRSILLDYCAEHQHTVYKVYVDDGYSGMNFNRPGFQSLLEDVEKGAINMVLTKDLSRLGRDYIMTGYYSEMFFQSRGVRYIALADDFDTLLGGNDIAPFRNLLNDLYARDLSRKIKNSKRQIAKQGRFNAGQAPYGYEKDSHPGKLTVDPEAAEVVRLIFSLAEQGLGSVLIAKELHARHILAPSAYKFEHGNSIFANSAPVKKASPYAWCTGTIGNILNDRVYLGELTALKTEVINCKTKQRVPVPKDKRIVTPNAHEAIVSLEQFERVQKIRSTHKCPAKCEQKENIFRGKLFCECCGHPLSIANKQLKERQADIYFCQHHYLNREECPQTHRIYHDMLYNYVLQQVKSFASFMKRRKIGSAFQTYASINQLTPEISNEMIERIEIGHLTRKSRAGNVIKIYWKAK